MERLARRLEIHSTHSFYTQPCRLSEYLPSDARNLRTHWQTDGVPCFRAHDTASDQQCHAALHHDFES